MEKDPIKRLKVGGIACITFLILGGIIAYFMPENAAGWGLLVGGVISLIYIIISYFKIREKNPTTANKLMKDGLTWFYIIGGGVITIFCIIVLILIKEFIFEMMIGPLFLIYGLYQKFKK